jgi:hypothetical protein
MSNRGQAQYLRIFDGDGTYVRHQSYYVNQTVTLDGQQWSYFPFVANGLISGSAGTDSSVSITVPATEEAITAFESGLNLNRLVQLLVYEFDTRLSQSAPQSGQSLIGSFIGEIVRIQGSFTSITIDLGSALAPVGAQSPPRNYTSRLVGAPLRP